jgi:hypothetical protein
MGRPSNYKTRLCLKWQQHGECSFGNRCNFAHGSKELSLALSFAPPSGAAPAAPAASQNIGWCSRNPVPWNRKSLPSYSENGITIFVDENGNTKRAAKEAGLRPF